MRLAPYDPVAAGHGRWTLDPRRRVLVWVTEEPAPVTSTTPPEQIIACPKCRATATQTCRTKGGHRTRNHPARVIPRVCPCGGELAERATYCAECRVVRNRDLKREQRARERKAAA